MRMWLTVWCAACFLIASAGFAAEVMPKPYGQATATMLRAAPVLDGVISPGEWDGAVRTTGFQSLTGDGRLDARQGFTYFGFTEDAIYIAVISEMPPDGKLHADHVNRDSDVIFDESIEIWLDPNRANRESASGALNFYQLIYNPASTIYDVSFHPKTGPNTGWNGHWTMKNSVDQAQHRWVSELSLPFEDIGWKKGEILGRKLGVLIARNYKAPWVQGSWFRVAGAFVDWYRYAEITLTKDAPTVHITSLGDTILKANLQLRLDIHNPGPAREVKVNILTVSSDMPERRDAKTFTLPAGTVTPYSFDVTNFYHEAAQHQLLLTVTSADGKEQYLTYYLPWAAAPEKKWGYRVGADPDAAVRFAYYPSYRFVRLRVDTRELSDEMAANCKQGQAVLTDAAGQTLLTQRLAWQAAPLTQELKVGDLPDGTYMLTVTLDGWKEPFARTFTRTHFPWEGNTLGITDQVLAPFTPVVVKGTTASVVSRTYTYTGLGLPAQVTSLGHPLLASPMTLVADGATVLQGKGKFTSAKPNKAVYEGNAATPTVKVVSRTTTELDGCLKVELTMSPVTKEGTLSSLWLDIPMRDSEARLWHATSTSLRVNPAGTTPAGEGVIWDSRQFPDGNWYGNFKCYLWLGGEERGLCWFADNDKDWELNVDDKNPEKSTACQQLIRKDGVLTLRVNLVQRPVTLTEPRTIVFGLMASPAKPMPADWRRRTVWDESFFNMGYATPAGFSAKAPWGGDYIVADWAYNRRTGKGGPTPDEIEAWKARNFPADMDPKFRTGSINLALNNFVNTFRPNQKYYKMYFDEFHTTSQAHPETKVFQSEWSGNWNMALIDHPTVEGHKDLGISIGGIVRSHQDFACWYAAEWVKRGIGIYFDNAFPTRAYDPLTTEAYVLPNGQTQPSAGMWARRDYLRRIWTIHRTMAPADPNVQPAMMIHMTNTHILPYMVWNDENLDLEWKFGPEIQQTKFPHDLLRAEALGWHTGNVPYVLDRILDAKSAAEKSLAHRTKFGTMMVHELRWWDWNADAEAPLIKLLKDFGYGLPDCQVWNYWQEEYPVLSSDTEAKSLLLKRGDELLLLICTWNPQSATVTFMLDTKAIGLIPTSVLNAEKPDEHYTLEPTLNTFNIPLEGYAVRILRIK